MRVLLVGKSLEALGLCEHLQHDVAHVVDPLFESCATWRGKHCLVSDQAAVAAGDFDGIVIAIDDPQVRRRAFEFYAAHDIPFTDVVGGRKGDGASSAPGLFLQFYANLSEGSRVGLAARLNISANVMHDAVIGDFVTVAPGATVLGHVSIGDGAYIGAGATVLPNTSIGAGAIIGAGAVVTRDVADAAIVKGVPAR